MANIYTPDKPKPAVWVNKLWDNLTDINTQYVEGLITEQEKNIKMLSLLTEACWLADQKKDKSIHGLVKRLMIAEDK